MSKLALDMIEINRGKVWRHMNETEARAQFDEWVRQGVTPTRLGNLLLAEGLSIDAVRRLVDEYEEKWTADQMADSRFTREIYTFAAFIGCGGFAYFLLYASTTRHFFAWPLLVLGGWGLIRLFIK